MDDLPSSHVLLDIEGTTTSITFVVDVLFPYVRTRVESFLSTHYDEPSCQGDIVALAQLFVSDETSGASLPAGVSEGDASLLREVCSGGAIGSSHNKASVIEAAVHFVHSLMDKDRKVTALKQLQGRMWEGGYVSGELVGHVYDDVVPAIQSWRAGGKGVSIYSSGSIAAQRLLFGYSSAGDLNGLFERNYDTTIGSKLEDGSYTAIVKDLGIEAASALFITDNIKEAYAASKAGLRVLVSIRPGNAALPESHPFTTITSFDQVVTANVAVISPSLLVQ